VGDEIKPETSEARKNKVQYLSKKGTDITVGPRSGLN